MSFENEIEQLTTSIWDAILHLPVVADGTPLPTDVQTMNACVHITGAWRGAVALSCGKEMASEAAEIMFGLESNTASKVEMEDAVGELVNMIGGNVKALLPESCQLSLPAVVQGSSYTVRVPGSRLVSQVPFRCGEHALNVSLLQSDEKAA